MSDVDSPTSKFNDEQPTAEKQPSVSDDQSGTRSIRKKPALVIGVAILAAVAVISFLAGRSSQSSGGATVSIGGAGDASESYEPDEVPTTDGEVGTPIVRDNYEFTVESYKLLPKGEGVGYSEEYLEKSDSREFQIQMTTKSKWEYSFSDMEMSVALPTITVNGKYDYTSDNSYRTGGQAGGIGDVTLNFTIPNDIADSMDSVEFVYQLNENPSDGTGGSFTTKETSSGTKLEFSRPEHTVAYRFKLL